jgi:hypothetical protein
MVTPEGTVKLIDFGISKPLAPELIPGDSLEPRTGNDDDRTTQVRADAWPTCEQSEISIL